MLNTAPFEVAADGALVDVHYLGALRAKFGADIHALHSNPDPEQASAKEQWKDNAGYLDDAQQAQVLAFSVARKWAWMKQAEHQRSGQHDDSQRDLRGEHAVRPMPTPQERK